ncbi:hypothetical protein OJ998_02575 [Solirubrobacter taibaiensis]|nr:hypothetical protein [Solirubrobacter taibaiensis]
MRLLLSLPVALAMVAVCSAGAAADPPAAQFDRVCETHAEGAEPDDIALPDRRRDVVAGSVSIVGANRLSGRKPPANGRSWVLKQPVIIRAGAPVVIRVAARDRRYVALEFDPDAFSEQNRTVEDGLSSVRFHACPPDTKRFSDGKPLGEWTGYPGGLIVARPRCVTLEFLEEGKPTVRRRVGIGRRCR